MNLWMPRALQNCIGGTFKEPWGCVTHYTYLRLHICISILIGNTKGTIWNQLFVFWITESGWYWDLDFSLLPQNLISSRKVQIKMNVSHSEQPSRWPTLREEPGTSRKKNAIEEQKNPFSTTHKPSGMPRLMLPKHTSTVPNTFLLPLESLFCSLFLSSAFLLNIWPTWMLATMTSH